MKVHVTVRGVAPLYKIFGKKNDIDLEFPGSTLRDLVDQLIQPDLITSSKTLTDTAVSSSACIRYKLNSEAP